MSETLIKEVTLSAEDVVFLTNYLVGDLLALAIGGATLSQGAFYLVRSGGDRTAFRVLVAGVLFLGFLHMVFVIADVAQAYAQHFGNFENSVAYSWQYSALLFLDGLISSSVQAFYAWRCWTLLGFSPIIAAVFSVLITFGLASWMYVAVTVQLASNNGEWPKVGTTLCFSTPVVVDILITTLMLIGLHRAKGMGKKSVGGGQGVIRRLAALTISTNALTLAFCCIQLGATLQQWTGGDGDVWNGTDVLMPLLPWAYICTLLTWLMSRMKETTRFTTDSNSHSHSLSHSNARTAQPVSNGIIMQTITQVHYDEDEAEEARYASKNQNAFNSEGSYDSSPPSDPPLEVKAKQMMALA